MLRFKSKLIYNKLAYYPVDNNGDIILEEEQLIDLKPHEIDGSLLEKFLVTNYIDFLKVLTNEAENRINKAFYNFLIEDEDGRVYLLVAKKELLFNMRPLVLYQIEANEFKDLLASILGFNDDKDSTLLIATKKSNFSWISIPEVLKVMFVTTDLKRRNEEIFAVRHKKKKNGKVRTYYAPHEEIKEALRELNLVLQRIYDKKNETFQVAYKKGKSVYDNAKIHKDKKYVFNIDLHDFYPSCKRELVQKYVSFFFSDAPNSFETMNRFLDCILINDGLFIGSPVSGCLANMCLHKPVAYIKRMCKKHDMEFSVYADDMSFSSDKFLVKEYVYSVFKEAFVIYKLDDYFSLNEEKSIGYTGCNRKVTGLSINQNNNITTSRKYYRTLRTMIAHLANDENSVNIQKLQGKIAYALMVDDSGKIFRYLKKFESTVRKYNLCSEEKMAELEKRFS